jgi:hypothetical protein
MHTLNLFSCLVGENPKNIATDMFFKGGYSSVFRPETPAVANIFRCMFLLSIPI